LDEIEKYHDDTEEIYELLDDDLCRERLKEFRIKKEDEEIRNLEERIEWYLESPYCKSLKYLNLFII